MKLFKTTLLASAVALSMGATAELVAMNDADLDNVVGQAGFTIQNQFSSGTNGINIALGDPDGTGATSPASEAGWLILSNLQPTGKMEIDFDGADRSINIKNDGATNINFDLAVGTTAEADAFKLDANTEIMAKVRIQLPDKMTTKITAH